MSQSKLQLSRAALQADPTQAQAWVGYIAALMDDGQATEAGKIIAVARSKGLSEELLQGQVRRLALASETAPPSAPAQAPEARPAPDEINQLVALFQARRFAELEPLARRMTVRLADFAFGWSVLGAALAELGRQAEALDAMVVAAQLEPLQAQTQYNLGKTYNDLHRHAEAEASLRRALEIDAGLLPAHYQLGLSLYAQGQYKAAEACYHHVIAADPTDAPAHNNLGIALNAQGQRDAAETAFRRAVALDAQFAEAHVNLASVLLEKGLADDAIANCRKALSIDANNAHARNHLGLAFAHLGRHAEAEEQYRLAISRAPALSEAHTNLGNVLMQMGRHAEAEASHRKAIDLTPRSFVALCGLGATLVSAGQLDQALGAYEMAREVEPGNAQAHTAILFGTNYHPDKTPEDIYAVYQAYDCQFGAPHYAQWPVHINRSTRARRLRVGYVSPDFRQHVVGYFLEPLLASHDHSRFEIFAYAELKVEDAATARYRGYCDHFTLTRGMSDDALAARIRADGIDVLVDVAGHTADNRLLTFARKPAPVSLSWMGYGYTTGLKAIDYLLIDEASAPVGSEHLFSETPWRLPCAYVYRPDAAVMGDVSALPAVHGPRPGRVTFGTLTRSIRINHRTIRVWSEILKRVAGSVLVIDSRSFSQASMQEDMARRFAEHGLAPEQLQIGCHSPAWDTLRAMDIALDCFPHNSGTTLFESLFMGVPFVTLAGRPSVGRLGRTVLTGLGRQDWLGAWCADSEQDYIAKAVALASDLPALARIRQELRATMQRSALMDEAGFARNVEQAYAQMFERWQATHVMEVPQ